jgi:hypothetical protein
MSKGVGVMTEAIVHDLNLLAFLEKNNPTTIRVLKVFLDMNRPLSIDDVVFAISTDISIVRYCFDLLIEHDLIVQTKAGFESSWTERDFPDLYVLSSRGRKYFLENETG